MSRSSRYARGGRWSIEGFMSRYKNAGSALRGNYNKQYKAFHAIGNNKWLIATTEEGLRIVVAGQGQFE